MKGSLADLMQFVSTWDTTGWSETDLAELEALIDQLKREANPPFYMREGFNALHAIGDHDPNATNEENAVAAKEEADLNRRVSDMLGD
jgi:hypothetical protein